MSKSNHISIKKDINAQNIDISPHMQEKAFGDSDYPNSSSLEHTTIDNLQNDLDTSTKFGHNFNNIEINTIANTPLQLKQAPSSKTMESPLQKREGGGNLLPEPIRQKMEVAFGTDFSNVRIHETSQVQDIGAMAYTQGDDIYFSPGKYHPSSAAGQSLLGHELTHVIQQRAGRVTKQVNSIFPINTNPLLEAEADQMGTKASQGQTARVNGSSSNISDTRANNSASSPIQCAFPLAIPALASIPFWMKLLGAGALGGVLGGTAGLINNSTRNEDIQSNESSGGKEHTSNKRPSTRGKHEKGQSRSKRDYGQEKGDKRRGKPRKRPRNWKGSWP